MTDVKTPFCEVKTYGIVNSTGESVWLTVGEHELDVGDDAEFVRPFADAINAAHADAIAELRAESERLQSALAEALAARDEAHFAFEGRKASEEGAVKACNEMMTERDEALAANGALVERFDDLVGVANRVVLTVPSRDNPHAVEFARAVGASIAALSNPTEAGRAWRERVVAEARKEQREADDVEWEEAIAFASQPKTPTMREIIAEHDAKVRAAALEEAAGCFDDAYDNDVSVYENVRLLKSAVRALASPAAPPAPSEPDCATAKPKPPMGDAERQRKLAKIDALIAALPPCATCNSTRKVSGEGFMGVPVRRDCHVCVRSIMPQVDAIWAEPDCATCGGDGFIWRPGGGRIPDRACPDCAPSAKPSGDVR